MNSKKRAMQAIGFALQLMVVTFAVYGFKSIVTDVEWYYSVGFAVLMWMSIDIGAGLQRIKK